jgi:hypothetical protein
MKIIINNKDLDHITIDTYQIFDLERETESMIESYNEAHGTDAEYDDLDIDYDLEGYREHLAELSVQCLSEELSGDPIIKGIKLIGSSSPREYNYTTDSYTAEFDYDHTKLIDWIAERSDLFRKYLKDSGWEWTVQDSDWNDPQKISEDATVAMIAYYISQTIYPDNPFKDEAYLLDMLERSDGMEYISIKEDRDA